MGDKDEAEQATGDRQRDERPPVSAQGLGPEKQEDQANHGVSAIRWRDLWPAPCLSHIAKKSVKFRGVDPTRKRAFPELRFGVVRLVEHALAPILCRAIGRPVAAERHEQSGDIRQAGRFRLDACNQGVEIDLLRIQQGDLIDQPLAELFLEKVETVLGGGFGLDGGLHRARIALQVAQGIGDILQGGNDGLPVERVRLIQRGLRGLLLVIQREAVEQGLRRAAGDRVEQRSRREQLGGLERDRARIGTDGEARQARGDRDADQRACRMHEGLGRPDIRTLPHQCARQAHRQVRRQREMPQIECLQHFVGGELAGQRGQQIALHRKLLVQRR